MLVGVSGVKELVGLVKTEIIRFYRLGVDQWDLELGFMCLERGLEVFDLGFKGGSC